jgi:hypothetical protein
MNIVKFINKLFKKEEKAKSPTNNSHKKTINEQVDIKFSSLIKSIHGDMVAANQSLGGVGLKYIEKFFDKTMSPETEQTIVDKIDAIDDLLQQGNTQQSQALLEDLKQNIKQVNCEENENIHYRPKMTSFEMPIFADGHLQVKTINVPLLSLAPYSVPEIQQLTLTSKLEAIKQVGEDTYVRIMPLKKKRSFWGLRKGEPVDSHTISISMNSQQSDSEINDVISHYQKKLQAVDVS